MANKCFKYGIEGIMAGDFDLTTDTIHVMLIDSVYTFANTTQFIDAGGAADIIDAEIVTAGYTAEGVALGTKAIGFSTDYVYFDAADSTWASLAAGVTIAAFVVYYNTTGVPTTSIPLVYIDTTTGVTLPYDTTGGSLTIQWNANGIFRINTNP